MWIELHDNLPDHPKIVKLAALTKMDRDLARAKLERLWLWALTNRLSGALSYDDVLLLTDVMRIKGDPQKMVDALVTCGLLEDTGDGYYIHDWDEHAGALIDRRERQRQQARERKRKSRDKCDDVTDMSRVTSVTVTHSTVPIPNKDSIDDPTTLSVCARETDGQPVDNSPLPVDNLDEQIRETITEGFTATAGRAPKRTEVDALMANTGAGGGMSPDMIRLAVSKAVTYGASSIAGYACKVMGGWRLHELFTPEAVERWEMQRDAGT